MDPLDKLTIETPEQTALEFPLAGVGSRFVAMLTDTAIQIVIGFVLFFALTLSIPALSRVASIASQWVVAAMIVGFFVIYYGYFAIFEALWNGQTPGKRYTQLRVMKDDGRPISPYEAIARNLLRIIDQLPVFYGVAMISVFFSKQNKRLGDFVAGTVVVHEKNVEAARPFQGTQIDGSTPVYNVELITVDELRLIETFLQRRDTFDPALRGSMAAQITARISAKLAVEVRGWPANEKFLEAVHSQYRATNRFAH